MADKIGRGNPPKTHESHPQPTQVREKIAVL
jgi:hypothetical protein